MPPHVAEQTSIDSDVVPAAATDLYASEQEASPADETGDAKRLAERYRLEFVDMGQFRINQELFRSIPADLMLRYGFVPHERQGDTLVIVVSDRVEVEQVCLWHGVLFGKVEHIQIDAVCIPICFGVAVLTLCAVNCWFCLMVNLQHRG